MLAFFKNIFQPKIPNAAMAWASIQNKAGNQASNRDKHAYWLYAVPVHLVLQRDTFSLAEPVPLVLNQAESDALTAALNQHFAEDGTQFFWHQKQWFLRLESNPNIQTHAPQAALNMAVGAYLPTGEGATTWASFINEIQMLLFEHAVNIAREAKGLPAMNSVWCYGGGHIL